MKIVDMRCRPAFLHDFFGATPGTPAYATTRWINRRVGTRISDEHFTRSLTLNGFLEEVRDAALTKAVVVGRQTPSQRLPNEKIHEIVRGHESLLGIAGIDPASDGLEQSLRSVDHAIDTLGLVGVDLEPGFGEPARHPDDPVYWPLYEHLSQRGIPLFLMSGPTTPDPQFNDPTRLAAVAQAFPRLRIVCYHGYWPNVQQILGIAFRFENVSVVPDMYLFQAGSAAYVEAANGFLADQILFGSSYPFLPIRQSVDDALLLGFNGSALDKFLYRNAAALFGL